MATITQTIEETLTFTAKPPQKQKQLQFEEPAKESYGEKLGPQMCPPGCIDCKRMTSQIQICPPDCKECEKISQPQLCPENCLRCKKQQSKTMPFLFNALGIFIAILATYMIVSTDSHLYLVFWVGYSVLRRLMTKSKSVMEKPKTD